MIHLLVLVLAVFSHIRVNNAFEMQSRIVHGYTARSAHQFPFYAFLEIVHVDKDKGMACGGTLLSDEWIITAAHCLSEAANIRVHLGTSNLMNIFESGHIVIPVEKKDFHIYPRYFKPIAWNDIALIRLPKKVQFTSSIQPAHLPTTCESTENIDVIALGNGATSNEAGISPQLRFALLKTLPLNICRRVFPIILLRKSLLCAYNDVVPQSVCQGDSGGPLIKSDGTLIGVSCFVRHEGCEEGLPQGFTNVLSYLKWIKEVTGLDAHNC